MTKTPPERQGLECTATELREEWNNLDKSECEICPRGSHEVEATSDMRGGWRERLMHQQFGKEGAIPNASYVALESFVEKEIANATATEHHRLANKLTAFALRHPEYRGEMEEIIYNKENV